MTANRCSFFLLMYYQTSAYNPGTQRREIRNAIQVPWKGKNNFPYILLSLLRLILQFTLTI